MIGSVTMDLLASYDPYVVFSLSVGLVLALCVASTLLMRDPYSMPTHPISQRLWCAGRHQRAETGTGCALRTRDRKINGLGSEK